MRLPKIVCLLLLTACGDSTTGPPPVATSIELSTTSLTFNSLGQTEQLTATVQDQSGATIRGAELTWTSSSASVATVSSAGLVTAVADGTATITATSGSVSAIVAVTVQVPVSLDLSYTILSFAALSDTTQLIATVKNAGGTVISNPTVTWATSSSSVATVSSAGLVTAVADGTATITATSGSASGTATVTVQTTSSDER